MASNSRFTNKRLNKYEYTLKTMKRTNRKITLNADNLLPYQKQIVFQNSPEKTRNGQKIFFPKFWLSPCGMPHVRATIIKSQIMKSLHMVNQLRLAVIAYWPMSLLFGIWKSDRCSNLWHPRMETGKKSVKLQKHLSVSSSFPAVLKYSLFVIT